MMKEEDEYFKNKINSLQIDKENLLEQMAHYSEENANLRKANEKLLLIFIQILENCNHADFHEEKASFRKILETHLLGFRYNKLLKEYYEKQS